MRAQRAVDEAELVQCRHGSAEVEGHAPRGVRFQRPFRQDLAQAAPLGELHGHEGVAVLGLAELQHADQRRMGRRGHDDRSTRRVSRRRRMRRARDPAGEKPDRDVLSGRLVLGTRHVPEGAGTQVADDSIAGLWHHRRPRQALPDLPSLAAFGRARAWRLRAVRA